MANKWYLVRFSKKTGKIDTTMECESGFAMLKLWGLTKTTKSKDSIVFDNEGKVIAYYEGTGDFPKISEPENETVDMYCEGLLEAITKE